MKTIRSLRHALACALTVWASAVAAQAWPSKPLTIIVPFGAGSGNDQVARLLGQELSTALGQPVIVENKAGAGGNIGAAAAAKAAPDGYTLFVTTNTTQAANPSLYKQLPYDPIKDFAPVGRIANTPALLVAGPSLSVKNLPELIALAKSKPGKLTYASGSSGTLVPAAMLTFEADIDMVHVPYKSIPDGLKDVMGGTVDLMFTDMATGTTQAKAGRVKALAISSLKPSPMMPDVPPIATTLPGFELLAWYAMYVPTGTPPAIIERLNREIAQAEARPAFRERLSALGLEPITSTPAELASFTRSEMQKWGQVIRRTGATPQ